MESTITRHRNSQAGFSLIEVMIAGAIMMIGLLAVLGLFGTALAATQASQLDEIAHARATQTIESIYTARQTSQFGFSAIDNTTAASGLGKFTAGMIALTDPGPDGLDGTSDEQTRNVRRYSSFPGIVPETDHDQQRCESNQRCAGS